MKNAKIYLFAALSLVSINSYSQQYGSTAYQSYIKAKHIFDKLIQANKYNSIDSLSFKLSGNWDYLGHYSLPEKRKVAKVTEKINQYITTGNSVLRLTGQAVLEGSTYNKSFYYSNDSLSLTDYGEKTPKTGVIKIGNKIEAIMLSPITLVRDIGKRISTLRYVGFDQNDSCDVLTYSSSLGKQITFYVKNKDFTIFKSELLDYDALHGDYIKEYFYRAYNLVKDFLVPSELIVKEWGVLKKKLNYTYNTIIDGNARSCKNYRLKKINHNFYSLVLPTEQHRVFVLDFGSYLGIIEAPVNNNYSSCVYQVLRNNFPNKEIKYLFLSHHHPDHAGGFYYYLKKGLTIVTTRISQQYFEKLAARSHSIKNHLFSSLNAKGKFEAIPANGIKKITSEDQSLIIYEFGKESLHTKEYLLFYLPRLKILILGDLWRVPLKGVYGSKRAVNMGKFIKQHKLKVNKIYQSWPLQNTREAATFDQLKESIQLSKQK